MHIKAHLNCNIIFQFYVNNKKNCGIKDGIQLFVMIKGKESR